LPAIFIALATTLPAIVGPLNEATTSANKAGQVAVDNYKPNNLSATPQELQQIFNEAFFEDLNHNPYASIVHRVTDGTVCKPRLVDGNTIYYNDLSSVAQAQRELPKLTTDNSDAKNLSDLQQRYIEELNSLKDTFAQNKPALKEKLLRFGLKTDDAFVLDTEEKLSEKLTEAANEKLDSYYKEKGIERSEQIIYDTSDHSFCSQSSDLESQISSEQSLADENNATAFTPLDKDTINNWVKDQGE